MCAPRSLPAMRCWTSARAPTRPPPTWGIGIARRWRGRDRHSSSKSRQFAEGTRGVAACSIAAGFHPRIVHFLRYAYRAPGAQFAKVVLVKREIARSRCVLQASMARFVQIIGFLGCFGLFALPARAQHDRGELQIEVHDSQGAVLSASGELVSEGNQFHLNFSVGDDGRFAAKDLAFGVYRVSVSHSGFVPAVQLVEIRSMVPQHLALTLGLKPVETQVQVSETETLVDPSRTSTVYTIGSQTLDEQISSQPGRSVLDAVDAQPGWLYEANGVLHPRGSEYDVQFVVDGLPLTQNRSPAFAPPFESNDVDSMRVMTAGFPAEYGRKLGGVVEITSPKNTPAGLHGEFDAEGGSFSTGSAHAALFYANGENRFSISGDGFHTERYLDPPVLANFTNTGNAGGFSASYERDFSNSDRVFVTLAQNAVRYLAPNELVQQQSGQRQDSEQKEIMGQVRYTHAFS